MDTHSLILKVRQTALNGLSATNRITVGTLFLALGKPSTQERAELFKTPLSPDTQVPVLLVHHIVTII